MKRQNSDGNIRKRGLHCWEGSVLIQGKRHYVYGKTPNEVRKKISALTLQSDLDLLNSMSDILLSDWLNQWITSYTNVKENTLSRYKIDVEQHITPVLGKIALCDLKAEHIQMFYNRMIKEGMSAKSLKNLHGVLHEALERAVLINLIPKNVSNACVLPRVKQAEMHPLQGDEIPRFLEAIKGDTFENVYYVDLFTGMRQGEILGLSWDSISFDSQTIFLYRQLQRSRKNRGEYYFTDLKNSKSRYIQPAPEVMTILQKIHDEQIAIKNTPGTNWHNDHHLVFVDKNGHNISCMTLYHHFKAIAAQIGKPEMRFHDLRHTYATLSLQTGANIKTISSQLGHSTTAFTLDRYGHTTDPMRRDAADRMSAYIRSITDEETRN